MTFFRYRSLIPILPYLIQQVSQIYFGQLEIFQELFG